MACDAFYDVTVFKSHFSSVNIRNDAFSKRCVVKSLLLKPFSKVSVFIGVFGRFSVDDRRKRVENYAFSNENALVWMESTVHLSGAFTTELLGDSRQAKLFTRFILYM